MRKTVIEPGIQSKILHRKIRNIPPFSKKIKCVIGSKGKAKNK